MPTPDLRGSCICGSVSYEVYGPCREIIACHCSECRKASGHHTAATATAPENLHIRDEGSLTWYRSSPDAERGFCGVCGSTLFWKPASGDRVSIFAGSIDGSPDLSLVAHIHLGEKGSYYNVSDELPGFDAGGATLRLE